MNKFSWGKIIDRFEYDFDGKIMKVTKYHPWIVRNGSILREADTDKVEYHCAELNESSTHLHYLIIAWIARQHLGSNNHSLVNGISRALRIS